jgi:nitrite reductase/ring-hydroxylating ferredoxin subunit
MDWMDLEGRDLAVGVFHGTVNIIGTVLFIVSFFLRSNNSWLGGGWATVLAIVGYLVIMFGGYLGGTLVFRRGVMVDRNAYAPEQGDFVDAMNMTALPERKLMCVEVAGQKVLLYREGERTSAIGAVCSHLGGPLQAGKVKDNCVECPWHYSQFSLVDGHVHDGPATAPVPAYETRVTNGKLQVRRKE